MIKRIVMTVIAAAAVGGLVYAFSASPSRMPPARRRQESSR